VDQCRSGNKYQHSADEVAAVAKSKRAQAGLETRAVLEELTIGYLQHRAFANSIAEIGGAHFIKRSQRRSSCC